MSEQSTRDLVPATPPADDASVPIHTSGRPIDLLAALQQSIDRAKAAHPTPPAAAAVEAGGGQVSEHFRIQPPDRWDAACSC